MKAKCKFSMHVKDKSLDIFVFKVQDYLDNWMTHRKILAPLQPCPFTELAASTT